MSEPIYQSVARRVPFKAFLASDHVTPATGKTIPVVISKNGGAFGNPSAGATNATAIASGWYYVDLSTTDTATLGPLIVRGAEGTIDDAEAVFEVVSGHRLAADGLDLISVTAPTAGATTFPGMVVQTWRRFFRRVTKTSSTISTFADDGTTVITTQTISDNGTTEVQGAAS
jgi:hypothetical protein